MELYVHIPYCAKKCRYCDFASFSGLESTMSEYIDAVLAEGQQRKLQLHNPQIDTVFIGGGTPSLLPAELFDKLLSGICSLFEIVPGAEFTCEANPGTLTENWLKAAVDNGVNRISIGMQAAQDGLLELIGRIHRFQNVINSVAMCKKFGISSINLDLMFGLPTQTVAMWEESIEAALSLAPAHISCYSLISEDGTPMKADIDSGRLTLPDENEEREMYDRAIRLLKSTGYTQYEISNFSLPGMECRHNIGYWTQAEYIGLGAAACSMLYNLTFTGGNMEYYRETNPTAIPEYISSVQCDSDFSRIHEDISPKDAQYETLMVGLRMTAGVSEKMFLDKHGISMDKRFGRKLRHLAQEGLLEHFGDFWRLTRSGLDLQNYVMVELMDD